MNWSEGVEWRVRFWGGWGDGLLMYVRLLERHFGMWWLWGGMGGMCDVV